MTEATADRTALAQRFIDLAIAAGDLKFGYGAIAACLTIVTGEEHTRGMVAGLLDRDAERDSKARASQGE
jgi:hypothetical protein